MNVTDIVLTPKMFLIVCPLLFLAGLVDAIGAHLSLIVPSKVMMYVLIIILPITAFFVLNKKLFPDKEDDKVILNKRTYLTATIAAFVIGIYDGFYGPGTGTFLIIAFTVFAKLGIKKANAQAKVINLTTNITSLIVFLSNGQVLIPLGLTGWVKNKYDGTVEAEIQGLEEQIDELIQFLDSQTYILVTNMDVKKLPVVQEHDFVRKGY